jgi:GTP cyclohydrolase FolE2
VSVPDVQNWPDDRGIGLDEVGVTGIRYPVSVFDAGQGKQDTVASVCPCSKAVSDYGAHNQRSHITIEASPVLKRADERHVTMHGYDHPVFVEDMARAAAGRLRADPRIARFTVTAESDESIHNHGAYARLSWPPDR